MAPGLVDRREGGAGEASDGRLVAHDRVADRAREDRLSDAEARGNHAPHGPAPPPGPATGASTPSPAAARSARSRAQLGRRFVLIDSSVEAVERRSGAPRAVSTGGCQGSRVERSGRFSRSGSRREHLETASGLHLRLERRRAGYERRHGVVALTIPAKAEYIALCRLALTGLARTRALAPEVVADLKLALTEACSNSVRHAYARAARAIVEIRYELGDGPHRGRGRRRRARVRPESSWSARRDELDEGGLGIAIIRALTDELEIEPEPEGRAPAFASRST